MNYFRRCWTSDVTSACTVFQRTRSQVPKCGLCSIRMNDYDLLPEMMLQLYSSVSLLTDDRCVRSRKAQLKSHLLNLPRARAMLRSSIIERRTWRPWHDRPEATIRDVAEDRVTVGCFQDHARCSCSSPGGSSGGVAWLGLWAASTRGGRGRRAFCFLVQNCSRAVPQPHPTYVSHTLYSARPHRLIPFRSPSCL